MSDLQNTTVFIHPSAIIDDGAQIGAGTKVWHFCHLMPGCVLGEGCILGQNVMIASDVQIGNRVKIQNNVSVYSGVDIEDDVFLGPSMVFTNVQNPRSFIERKQAFERTSVRKGATIGANATIVCGVEIGAYALIGAGSVVTQNVSPYALVVGNPGKQIGWVSTFGRTLRFDDNGFATCAESGQNYQLFDNVVQPIGDE